MNNNKKIMGKKVGTIFVSMYEENETGLPYFDIQAENRHLLPVLNAIENTLNNLD